MSELDDLRAKVAAVEALHFARGRNVHGDEVCNECSPLQPMPCPTLRALASVGDGTPTEPPRPVVEVELLRDRARQLRTQAVGAPDAEWMRGTLEAKRLDEEADLLDAALAARGVEESK